MGPKPTPAHTLERKETNGHYTPENCVWATQTVQQRNRRNNRIIEFIGLRLTLAEWGERMGIAPGTIHARIRYGWSIELAMTTPVRKHQAYLPKASQTAPTSEI
jgi:hypothetical protein